MDSPSSYHLSKPQYLFVCGAHIQLVNANTIGKKYLYIDYRKVIFLP